MEANKLCILLTGATSGIGLALAKELIKTNHQIILVASSSQKHQTTIKEFNQKNVSWFFCDLSLQKNIRKLCKELEDAYAVIDVLVNCAGMLSSNRVMTSEGVEKQLAVNHIAPFLLSELLRNQLMKSKNPKVVNISSRAVYRAHIYWDDLLLSKNYSLTKAYNQSKLLSLMCTIAQSKKSDKIRYLNIYPGLVKTKIGEKNARTIDGFIWKIIKKLGVSPKKAAKSILPLCLHVSNEYPSGSLLSPSKIVNIPRKAKSENNQERIFLLTQEMILDEY